MGDEIHFQGAITSEVMAVGTGATATKYGHPPAETLPPSRRVFVVHGRDLEARDAMSAFLRADLGLEPWTWESAVADLGQASPYSGQVVEHAVRRARAAVVLLTPDDEVRLHRSLWNPNEHPHERRFTGQPRPNVLIELGMVLAAYPDRVVIAEFGDLRQLNDISGRNVVRFGDDLVAALKKVAGRLEQAGCDVRRVPGGPRTDRFANLAAYRRTPEAGR